ncbi:hypothetical protein SAMN05216275_10987 [Streptosporangium canum]|uniref:Uncharacterized protein n=1 Tax=Streptosporangium canum TaxID=324952 RepID=A0A1I3RKP0_9ACTN|nr:hypothetical protein [Streptosporangium canum]SFJ47153.1 hypothetical protein SAMN05216275_10987 [Streptosporangium canum]
MPILIIAVWAVSYLPLSLLWAVGGPAYPFDAGRAGSGNTLLDPLPAAAGGAVLAVSALVAGVVAVLAVRGALNRAPAVVAIAVGVGLAVLLPDVRIMMTAGYLPVMLVAALAGQAEFSMIATMLTWPSVNLLILMAAGVSLMILGTRALIAGAGRPGSAAGALRVGQYATAVAVAVPVVYAVTRFGWLLGVPVGISDQFLAHIAEITPIGAGLSTLGLIGAVLTVGLVRPWGEIWPRWAPFLRGRPIPARLPAYSALAVSLPITSAGLMYVRKKLTGEQVGPAGADNELGAWLPEMLWPLWGAALAVAALAYLFRRRHLVHARRP